LSILNKFERRVDRLVNGAFAKAFATEVQPVEIAAALQREVDDKAVIIGAGRTVVPNVFKVELSTADFERLNAFAYALNLEMAGFIREHITEQRYTTLGGIEVSLGLDSKLNTGIFRVTAIAKDNAGVENPDPTSDLTRGGAPHVVVDGYVHALTLQRTVIGRGTECDIQIQSNGVSRKHCEIQMTTPIVLRDLGSTNGTWVKGQRITELELLSDVDITLGDSVIQFRIR
jgi:hypothetical protein